MFASPLSEQEYCLLEAFKEKCNKGMPLPFLERGEGWEGVIMLPFFFSVYFWWSHVKACFLRSDCIEILV